MKKKFLLFQVPVLIVFSSLIVYFFQFCKQAQHMVFDNHAFAWKPGPFLFQTALVFVIMTGLWLLFSKWLSRLFNTNLNDVRMQNILSWVPVLFFLFLPLANRHYLSSDDLITRFSLLGMAVLMTVLYLKAAGIWTLHLKSPSVFRSWANTFSKMPLKKKLVLLFFASILVCNAGSLMMTGTSIWPIIMKTEIIKNTCHLKPNWSGTSPPEREESIPFILRVFPFLCSLFMLWLHCSRENFC
jgi:hypothetical protein